MNLKQVSAWRNRAGKIGAVLCLVLFLSLLDALVARFREPLNHFSGFPGEGIAVTAPLTDQTENLRELTYKKSSEGITLHFEALQKGYWLGGAMWNGTLKIDPTAPPGTYTVTVQSLKEAAKNGGSLFTIQVFKNQVDLKKNSLSFFLRLLGISPWRTALFLFPWVIGSFGLVFFLSGQRERLLSQEGKAEIYRVRKMENKQEVFFALGCDQGIQPGMSLTLYNFQENKIGSISVLEVFDTYSTARVDCDWNVLPGFMVCR
jgi:hypothetical protein